MPIIHDRQSARELADQVLWWEDKIKKAWGLISRPPGSYITLFVTGLFLGALTGSLVF